MENPSYPHPDWSPFRGHDESRTALHIEEGFVLSDAENASAYASAATDDFDMATRSAPNGELGWTNRGQWEFGEGTHVVGKAASVPDLAPECPLRKQSGAAAVVGVRVALGRANDAVRITAEGPGDKNRNNDHTAVDNVSTASVSLQSLGGELRKRGGGGTGGEGGGLSLAYHILCAPCPLRTVHALFSFMYSPPSFALCRLSPSSSPATASQSPPPMLPTKVFPSQLAWRVATAPQ